MQTNKAQSSLYSLLSDEALTEMTIEFGQELPELSAKYSGYEGVVAVVTQVQRFATKKLGQPADPNLENGDPHILETVQRITSGILQRLLPGFIYDTHRKFIVRCHARGLSTSEAVVELIQDDRTMGRLIQPDAIGLKDVKRILVPRLAYLKPGTARWPEKKYGAVWHEERENHRKEMADLPLTSTAEQTALLARHADRIDRMLDDADSTADWQLLTNSLVKTVDSLRKVSTVEHQVPAHLSGMQLIAVLERLTLDLDTLEQLRRGADTDALVGVLERITLALKSPQHKAIAGEVKSLPTDTHIDSNPS